MGTLIDGVVGGGFRVTGGGRARGNLATGNGGGRAETVLSDAEGIRGHSEMSKNTLEYSIGGVLS